MTQDVLIEGIIHDADLKKEEIIKHELLDFKEVGDPEFIIGKNMGNLTAAYGLTVDDIGEIHNEVFSEGGVLGIFGMIMKVANFESRHHS